MCIYTFVRNVYSAVCSEGLFHLLRLAWAGSRQRLKIVRIRNDMNLNTVNIKWLGAWRAKYANGRKTFRKYKCFNAPHYVKPLLQAMRICLLTIETQVALCRIFLSIHDCALQLRWFQNCRPMLPLLISCFRCFRRYGRSGLL